MSFKEKKPVGIIGLGDMGGTIASILHNNGHPLIIYNRSEDAYKKFASLKDVRIAKDVKDMTTRLRRDGDIVIWLMIPGGEPTNSMVAKLAPLLRKGDIVIDGANATPVDSVKNYKLLGKSGASYLDVGCGGGPNDLAYRKMPIVVGGDRLAFNKVEDILSEISDSNCGYVGGSGAGQTVKLIHNMIFYAIGPAIAEGFALLDGAKAKRPDIDLKTAEKLLGECMPINGEVVQAILKARDSGSLPEKPPEMKVSEMVKWGAGEFASSCGIDIPVIRAVLAKFPELTADTRRIYAGAKKEITGH